MSDFDPEFCAICGREFREPKEVAASVRDKYGWWIRICWDCWNKLEKGGGDG